MARNRSVFRGNRRLNTRRVRPGDFVPRQVIPRGLGTPASWSPGKFAPRRVRPVQRFLHTKSDLQNNRVVSRSVSIYCTHQYNPLSQLRKCSCKMTLAFIVPFWPFHLTAAIKASRERPSHLLYLNPFHPSELGLQYQGRKDLRVWSYVTMVSRARARSRTRCRPSIIISIYMIRVLLKEQHLGCNRSAQIRGIKFESQKFDARSPTQMGIPKKKRLSSSTIRSCAFAKL